MGGNVYCGTVCQAVANTGSPFIGVANYSVAAIYAIIGAWYQSSVGAYVVDCSLLSTMPPLNFFFGGKIFTLTSNDYIVQV